MARRGNSVRVDGPFLDFGTSRRWDIGPYISFVASCYTSADGTHHFDQMLLNNAPGSGRPFGSNLVYDVFNNEGKSVQSAIPTAPIGSGKEGVIASDASPSTRLDEGTYNVVNFVWTDATGESVTGMYEASVGDGSCLIEGVLGRTT